MVSSRLYANDPAKNLQQTPTVASTPSGSELAEAYQAFHSGKFAEAAAKYRSILDKEPSSTAAQAGLVRSTLRLEKLNEALDLGTKYLTASPNDASLNAVMGEVHFRRAEMRDAEVSFRTAINLDPKQAHAYLGLADVLDSLALHHKAYDLFVAARAIAPDDPEVQRSWLSFLPRKNRIEALEKYLAGPHEESQEDTKSMFAYLAFLKSSNADHKTHPCKLTQPVERTQTDLEPLLSDASHLVGWGLKVKLNDHVAKLLVDTGASGVLISRRQAEKSGVVRISEDRIAGIGDSGPVTGYYGYVDHLQVGGLQFQDCVIEVSDKRSIVEDDGLIGADVFKDYVVNLDFREMRMRLEPLPARPDDTGPAVKSLNSEGDDEDISSAGSSDENKSSATSDALDLRTFVPKNIPKDRYVAPEMKSWTTVLRFGHELLVPTRVNTLPATKLFLLDTGAFNITFATTLAAELGKMGKNEDIEIRGLSGKVEKVYRAKDATLQFGNLRQKVEDGVTFDISGISRSTGTEISGILGFAMLNLMDIQIDYRDNLVNFNYDPTKLGLPDWNKKK
jgi:tetratricopeptide (TPR) repeat protein